MKARAVSIATTFVCLDWLSEWLRGNKLFENGGHRWASYKSVRDRG